MEIISDFDLAPADSENDYELPAPGKSTILFQLVEGGCYMFQRWDEELKQNVDIGVEFGEVQYEGGSAELENYVGMLEYSISEMLDGEFKRPGWYVMEGYDVHYTRGDGWMTDDDADHEFDSVRVATQADFDHFGVGPETEEKPHAP
jgi:hypothetical protein